MINEHYLTFKLKKKTSDCFQILHALDVLKVQVYIEEQEQTVYEGFALRPDGRISLPEKSGGWFVSAYRAHGP